MSEYNGGLTREQFLFYETRITAQLLHAGMSKEEAVEKIQAENLFQFPTERMVGSIAKSCIKRLEALDSDYLLENLAQGSFDVGKQINLYAMMRHNRIVWDFMVYVIGEKYRMQDFSFGTQDLNRFINELCEQNDNVASWSDGTHNKIKQVLRKCLIECEFLDSVKSTELNYVFAALELVAGIRANDDEIALAAFNYFE